MDDSARPRAARQSFTTLRRLEREPRPLEQRVALRVEGLQQERSELLERIYAQGTAMNQDDRQRAEANLILDRLRLPEILQELRRLEREPRPLEQRMTLRVEGLQQERLELLERICAQETAMNQDDHQRAEANQILDRLPLRLPEILQELRWLEREPRPLEQRMTLRVAQLNAMVRNVEAHVQRLEQIDRELRPLDQAPMPLPLPMWVARRAVQLRTERSALVR
jgi:chromosome segregation ATPase